MSEMNQTIEEMRHCVASRTVQKSWPLAQLENRLAKALYSLCSKTSLDLGFGTKEAHPLFERAYFSWGALPYPRWHAELGGLLALLGHKEEAKKIALWQLNTLDHTGAPLHVLFAQEGVSYAELVDANRFLFAQVGCGERVKSLCSPLDQTKGISLLQQSFPLQASMGIDETLLSSISLQEWGIVGRRLEGLTLFSAGWGCKSGLGAFLTDDAGFLNFGPMLSPLGDFDGFGIAGTPEVTIEETGHDYRLRAKTRMAKKSALPPYLKGLHYGDASGLYVEGDHHFRNGTLHLELRFDSIESDEIPAWVFLGKGKECVIKGLQRLKPQSLDRYKGPAESAELVGNSNSVLLNPHQGCAHMEVIPLAGEECFFGADFLIAYFQERREIAGFEIAKKDTPSVV